MQLCELMFEGFPEDHDMSHRESTSLPGGGGGGGVQFRVWICLDFIVREISPETLSPKAP